MTTDFSFNTSLTAGMSAAPEIALLASAASFLPAGNEQPGGPLTLGTLAGRLRRLSAAPERWWGLVRFDPTRSVRIEVEDQPAYGAWLMIMPPGDAGRDCDCHVATLIAGEAAEGGTALRPGPVRVHGQRHWLRGHGAGYSISLHARTMPASTVPASTVPARTVPGFSAAEFAASREFAIKRSVTSG